MKGFVSTLIGGALGIAALYAVGKIAFHAGYDIAEAETRYEQFCKETEKKQNQDVNDIQESSTCEEAVKAEEPKEKKGRGKLGMLFGLRKMFSKNGGSVIGNLLKNPENHVIEACVKGREIHVNVKPKLA